jgi:hypothetical protein
MKVWFQLFLGDAGLSPIYVTLTENDVIADLMKAVKIECGDNLQGVSSAQLRVYPPGNQVPVPEGTNDPILRSGGPVVHLNWGTSDDTAFVIVAPDIGTCFDLMEYLLLYCSSQLLILTYHFVSSIPYKYLATVEKTKERRNARN